MELEVRQNLLTDYLTFRSLNQRFLCLSSWLDIEVVDPNLKLEDRGDQVEPYCSNNGLPHLEAKVTDYTEESL